MVPVSELNSLRREVINKIEEARLAKFRRPLLNQQEFRAGVEAVYVKLPQVKEIKNKHLKPKLAVHIGDMASLEAALESGADLIYFGGDRLRRKKGFIFNDFPAVVKACHRYGAQAVYVIPSIFHEERIEKIKKSLFTGARRRS